MRKVIAVAAAAALLSIGAGAGAEPDVRSAALDAGAFTATYVRGPAEPSIALSSRDWVYLCGPQGVPGGNVTFIRSEDWTTFERQTIFDRGGGGDCDIAVGPDDTVYEANLQLWASAIRRSTDHGKTFSNPATEDAVEQDRQWLATDPRDPNVVYLGYHDWSVGAIVIAKSIDGGVTFPIHSLVSSDPVLLADAHRSTIPGTVLVDPNESNRVYMVWSTGTVAACAASPATDCTGLRTQAIVVGRSEDGGLTWANHVAMRGGPGDLLGFIPWLAVDREGNVYAAATGHLGGRNGTYLAASSDRGATWTGPVKVNAGEGAVTFPTVVAGDRGIVDLAWIESENTTGHDDPDGIWRVRFAQTRDGLSAAPTFTEVAGPVVHQGDVCMRGLGCLLGGDRSLLDFMDMELDSFGYAHMAVATNRGADGRTVSTQILYWRQDAGPSAYGEPCAPSCVSVRPGPRPA